MGVYVYTLRKTKIKSDVGPINLFKYLCKAQDLGDSWGEPDSWAKVAQKSYNRIMNGWEGIDHPKYAVLGDKFELGMPVYHNPEGLNLCYYDTDAMQAEVVGFLVKNGRKWIVQSIEETRGLERKAFLKALDLGLIKLCGHMIERGKNYLEFIKKEVGYDYLNFDDEFTSIYRA